MPESCNKCFYLRTRSELLRDPDRLRELSLDRLEEEQNDQVSSGYKERASQQICISCFTNFKLAVLIAVVDR